MMIHPEGFLYSPSHHQQTLCSSERTSRRWVYVRAYERRPALVVWLENTERTVWVGNTERGASKGNGEQAVWEGSRQSYALVKINEWGATVSWRRRAWTRTRRVKVKPLCGTALLLQECYWQATLWHGWHWCAAGIPPLPSWSSAGKGSQMAARQQDKMMIGGRARKSKEQCHCDCLGLNFHQLRKVSYFYSQNCSVSAAE